MNKKILVIYQDWGDWFTKNYFKFELWFKKLDGAYSPKLNYYILALGNENKVLQKEKNIKVELFKSSPVRQLFDLFKFKKRLKQVIKEQKPDYIYVYFSYLAAIVPKSADYKVITFIRDKVHEMIRAKGGIRFFISYIFYFLNYLALKHTDIALHNGKSLEKYIKKSNFKGKIIYSPRPVQDFEHFKTFNKKDVVKKHNIKGKKIITTISRLTKGKNVDMGIKALVHMPDYVFFIITGGEEQPTLEKLAEKLGVRSRVFFLGYLEHKYIWKYLKATDVFWLLSKTDFEGTPNALQEASMTKVPSIVSKKECMKNIIKDNYNGLILTSWDPKELADKTIKLVNDKKLYERIQENAFKKVKEIVKKRFEVKKLFR